MFYDDDDFRGWMALRGKRSARVFANPRDDGASNVKAWRAGIAAAKAGDAAGVLEALGQARGEAMPFNSKGKPARGPCARAIRELLEDPQARRRLAEGRRDWLPEESGSLEDGVWLPYCVPIMDLLWAANPGAVAAAAALWRRSGQASGQWRSNSFVREFYDGEGARLAAPLRWAAARWFDPRDYAAGGRGLRRSAPEQAPREDQPLGPGSWGELPGDRAERDAVESLMVEVAIACVEQLWGHEERAAGRRAAGETVRERASSDWGLGWPGARLPLGPRPDGSGGPGSCALREAARTMMSEVLGLRRTKR